MMKLGLDVGEENTDGVILNEANEVLASAKTATSKDIFSGIQQTIKNILAQTNINTADISVAALGTIHCTNNIVERKTLNKVGIIRICLPSDTAAPPLLGWPDDLVNKLESITISIHSCYECNGTKIAKLDYDELKQIVDQFRGQVDSIAISGVISPILSDQEKEVAAFLEKELPDIPVSLSSEICTFGLIEKENAPILNAALLTTISDITKGFKRVLENENIQADILFGKNDGTLMTSEYAQKYPIYTIAFGPTNSIRGAAYLSKEPNAIGTVLGDISCVVEKIFSLEDQSYTEAIKITKVEAINTVLDAGAHPDKIEITLFEAFPLEYAPDNTLLVRVKTAGPLLI